MNIRSHAALLGILLAIALQQAALSQTLLRDFDTAPANIINSSAPADFTPLPNGDLMFTAVGRDVGRELWTTDGTAAGTSLLVDLRPGSASPSASAFTALANGTFVFAADSDAEGRELWRTDGTASGTRLLMDISPGSAGSRPRLFTRFGSGIVFIADDGMTGDELWRTDGTAAGTVRITDSIPGPLSAHFSTPSLTPVGNNSFVFPAFHNTRWELWVSDGTAAGTRSIQPLNTAALNRPEAFTVLGNRVLFKSGPRRSQQQLWITDGTSAGTASLGALATDQIMAVGGMAYFEGQDAATGAELWKTDGTIAGTSIVADIRTGGGSLDSDPEIVDRIGNRLLFSATNTTGRFLYSTDGSASNTLPLLDLATVAFGSQVTSLGAELNGSKFLQIGRTPPLDGDVYRTDGTVSGTVLVSTVQAQFAATVRQRVLLSASDGGATGRELWSSDGTPGGTQVLADLWPSSISRSSSPEIHGSFRDQAIVTASDSTFGNEIWLSDGTPSGTRLLRDITPGSGSTTFGGIAANDRVMFFFANSPNTDGDPWISDGTTAGTRQLDLFPSNSRFSGSNPVAFGDRFVFAAERGTIFPQVWISDGTVTGTHPLADFGDLGRGPVPSGWFVFGDTLFFAAIEAGVRGSTLWGTDGTAAGTWPAAKLQTSSGGALAFEPVVINGRFWFNAFKPSSGVELWSSDGTPGGTGMAVDFAPGPASSRPSRPVAAGGRMLLSAFLQTGQQLISTDGTAGGSFVLTVPTVRGQLPGVPIAINDSVAGVVLRTSSQAVEELWRTDGTLTGTSLIGEFAMSIFDLSLARAGEEHTLIGMSDGRTGRELWTTDGSVSGTTQVFDMAPGSSDPRSMLRVGDKIVFTADDGLHGIELFAVPFEDSDDWAAESFGSGCSGTGGLIPSIDTFGAARISSAQPFGVRLHDARPSTASALFVAGRRGILALPGCTLWLDSSFFTVPWTTDLTGSASLTLPLASATLGLRLDMQALVLDPAGPALGLAAATAGLELVVGR